MAVFYFGVCYGTVFALANAKDVHLMGHFPVCLLKVKIHFSAMDASYSLTK
jgi:hypothetical protein